MSGPSTPDVHGGHHPAPARGLTAPAGVRMPLRYRAACPDCRAAFELTPGALRLAIGASPRTTFYSFTCPECGTAVRKPAGDRIVELLSGGGVSTLRLQPNA